MNIITCDKCNKPAQVSFMGWFLCSRHASEQFQIAKNLEEKRHRGEMAKIANEYRKAIEKGMDNEQ